MGYQHFKKDQRIEISILLKRGYSRREIATALGKHHSSVTREINNRSVRGIYDPHKAHHKAIVKRSHSKYQGMKIRSHSQLENFINVHMKHFWSPEQIAGTWNQLKISDDSGQRITISHKVIYKYIYSAWGQRLVPYLTTQRYKPRKRKNKKNSREIIPNRIFIDKRPKIINGRKRFGDWEGDTLGAIKSDKHVIAGLVERKSRFFLITKLPRLKYTVVGFNSLLNPYRDTLKSLTLDNGVENKRYHILKVPTYFCHPYSSWEKGAIENSFKRLRRFIPKKSSIRHLTLSDLSYFQNIMNNTPRKCLGFRTPLQIFNKSASSS